MYRVLRTFVLRTRSHIYINKYHNEIFVPLSRWANVQQRAGIMTDIYMFATRPWQCLSYATHHLLLTFVCVTKDIWAFATFLQRCQLPFFLSFVFIVLYFILYRYIVFIFFVASPIYFPLVCRDRV